MLKEAIDDKTIIKEDVFLDDDWDYFLNDEEFKNIMKV